MITLDGNTLESFGLIAQPGHEYPISPATVDRIISVPGMPGAYDFGADLGPRPFMLPLAWAKELSRSELQKKIRTFAAFLMDATGKPRNITLVFDYEPEKSYTVRYSGDMVPERTLNMAFFQLPMTAFDPYGYAGITAYDQDPFYYDEGNQYDSGLTYPNPESFQWSYIEHTSGLYVYSKLTTALVVTIAGSVTNPSITNLTTGETITVSTTISVQTLVIDGKRRKVTINGANAMQYKTGDFVSLLEGSNGLIFSGIGPNATVTYGWQHKFV